MTTHRADFDLNRPAALIAALPAVLGFVPEKSLVLVSMDGDELGSVLRVDLSDELPGRVEQLAEVAASADPEAAIAVIVDAEGAQCASCNEDYRELCDDLTDALSQHGVVLWAAHVVDRVALGGRWHCVDGCGSGGLIDDPSASPLAAAAVLDGRRLYPRRADLQAVIAVDDPARSAELVTAVEQQAAAREVASRADPVGRCRADVERAMVAAGRVAGGGLLSDTELAELGCALADGQVRDILYALAVGANAGEAEALWAVLARRLPQPWRVEALVLLAFSAYARGDGPLAGMSLEAALRCDQDHRMAGMLDTALQSGLRPERIRELALTGYRLARQLGVRLPPRRVFGRRAG
jgi:predicted transcriptional regulator